MREPSKCSETFCLADGSAAWKETTDVELKFESDQVMSDADEQSHNHNETCYQHVCSAVDASLVVELRCQLRCCCAL